MTTPPEHPPRGRHYRYFDLLMAAFVTVPQTVAGCCATAGSESESTSPRTAVIGYLRR